MVASGGRKEEPGMLFGVSSSKLGLWGLVIMSEPQEQADQPAKDERLTGAEPLSLAQDL